MIRPYRSSILIALVAWIAFRASVAAADATLPPAYFSPSGASPRDLAGWMELAAKQPYRVRIEQAQSTSGRDTPPATRQTLRPEIDYVRVRRLAADIPALEAAVQQHRLIIDLRYVAADLDESMRLGALLARTPLSLPSPVALDQSSLAITPSGTRGAGQQTIVLVNHETRGALEAVLSALQQSGAVLLVGRQTAGDTGFFLPVVGFPTVSIISGEFTATSGVSLLERGVTCGLSVETSPEEDEAGYLAFDAGSQMDDLLNPPTTKVRFDESTLLRRHAGNSVDTARNAHEPGAKADRESALPAFDRILQRGLNVLIAQEILRKNHSIRD